MKRLGIDTSTDAMSLALAEESKLIASQIILSGRQHGALLTDAVKTLLDQVSWTAQDIEEIYIGIGPGSYTGLRIGVTMAKVWGSQLNIPVYKVSSLGALASQVTFIGQNESDALIIPFMDARRKTAYTNTYTLKNKQIIAGGVDLHSDWDEFLENLDFEAYNKVYLVGENPAEFESELSNYHENVISVEAYPDISRALVGQVPCELVEDIDTLVPNYAHATLAEREWAERTGGEVADAATNARLVERYSAE